MALFSNVIDTIKIVWPWFIAAFIFSLLVPADARRIDLRSATTEDILMFLAYLLVFSVAFASMAVAWHRRVLLNEAPKAFHVRFKRRELRFFGKSILVALVFFLIAAVFMLVYVFFAMFLLRGGTFLRIVAVAMGVLFYFAIGAYMYRFALVLPATAIDRSFGLADGYRHGDGFGLAMAVAGLALAILVAGLSILLQLGMWGLATLYLQFTSSQLTAEIVLFFNTVSTFADTFITFLGLMVGLAVVTTGFRLAGESRGYDIYGNRVTA